MIIFNSKEREAIALHAQKEINKQEKFEKSLILPRGMIYWELDTATAEITEAQFETVHFVLGGHRGVHKKLTMKPGTLHVAAINKKNAERKFKKMVLDLLK